ncbi:hypothetical protein HZB02_07270 [Candidatus Woesearchaeota archaeon]|nr:hypothetical protein [Candidatus Woesearchaeota archaeon]
MATTISPLIATVLIVAFAVAVGTLVMQTHAANATTAAEVSATCVVPHNALGVLQLEYLEGKITREEYLAKEQAVIS